MVRLYRGTMLRLQTLLSGAMRCRTRPLRFVTALISPEVKTLIYSIA